MVWWVAGIHIPNRIVKYLELQTPSFYLKKVVGQFGLGKFQLIWTHYRSLEPTQLDYKSHHLTWIEKLIKTILECALRVICWLMRFRALGRQFRPTPFFFFFFNILKKKTIWISNLWCLLLLVKSCYFFLNKINILGWDSSLFTIHFSNVGRKWNGKRQIDKKGERFFFFFLIFNFNSFSA